MENAFSQSRGRGLTALFLIAFALASPVSAGFVNFDPDGPAAGNPGQTVAGLDWAVGNALADNALPPQVGATFQLYYQATLAGVINTSGLTVAPTGLNSQFEITAVMSATAVVTSVNPGTFTYALAATRSNNSFFEMWFDTMPDANNLAGTGFNDGTRIFLGVAEPNQPNAGSYTLAPAAGIQPFDQFGTNNYPGTSSVLGTGGFIDENSVTSSDPAFFVTPLASMSFNTSTVTPFKQVDPSALFAGLPAGAPPAVVPTVGPINGLSGPDFQFQADGNSSFTEVPEPGTALIAAGLTLTMVARRGRRK